MSLGLARFSYALLLPPMRADLGWSYLTAGMMNTVNALGYLFGALLVPRLLRRYSPRGLLLAGSAATAVLLAAHGLVLGEGALLLLRLRCPAWPVRSPSSAAGCWRHAWGRRRATASRTARIRRPALVLGLYYGGTGLGIIVVGGDRAAAGRPGAAARLAVGLAGAGRRGAAGHGADGRRHARAAGAGARHGGARGALRCGALPTRSPPT